MQLFGRTFAENGQGTACTGLGRSNKARQVHRFFNHTTIELDDHVTGLDTGLVCRCAGLYGLDQRARALAQAQGLGDFFGHLVNRHPDTSARDTALAAQLIAGPDRLVYRNGERDAHESARTRHDLAVDTHHLAAHINQRPTGIARVDGDIGLDERQEFAGVPLLGADDACGHRILQTKRRTDRHHPFADLEATCVTNAHSG